MNRRNSRPLLSHQHTSVALSHSLNGTSTLREINLPLEESLLEFFVPNDSYPSTIDDPPPLPSLSNNVDYIALQEEKETVLFMEPLSRQIPQFLIPSTIPTIQETISMNPDDILLYIQSNISLSLSHITPPPNFSQIRESLPVEEGTMNNSPKNDTLNEKHMQQNGTCSCRESRCIKRYCSCFEQSIYCGEKCGCQNCLNNLNTSSHLLEARRKVLARNPKAFNSKKSMLVSNHKGNEVYRNGCRCKKGCLKKYCVCRSLDVSCGDQCRCSGPNGCKNM